MEQPLLAHRGGIVNQLTAEVGATVTSGSTICEIVDP
jgi:acetyl-CoA/propionyl-CoA carboxylase biotin carboxyl carrier protein